MDTGWRVAVRILGAPFTRQALRDLRFCLIGAVTGLIGFIVVSVVLMSGVAATASVAGAPVGLALLLATIALARLLGALHRWLLRMTTGERITASVPSRGGPGPLGRLARRLRDRDGWRAVGYTAVKLPIAFGEGYAVAAMAIGLTDLCYPLSWLLFRTHPEPRERQGPMVAVVPVPSGHWATWTLPGTLSAALAGVVCLVAGLWLARGIIAVDAQAMRSMLGPSRISELERTRAIAVEDAAAALRYYSNQPGAMSTKRL
jgi:hypothetical protein